MEYHKLVPASTAISHNLS